MTMFWKLVRIFGKFVTIFGKLVTIFIWKLVSKFLETSFEKSGAIMATGGLLICAGVRFRNGTDRALGL